MDSATLPSGEYPFLDSPTWKYTGLGNGDGDFLVPPVPRLPSGVSGVAAGRPVNDQGKVDVVPNHKSQSNGTSILRDQSRREIPPLREPDPGKPQGLTSPSQQFSPIPELSTPNLSNPATPDLVKDSSPSAGGRSSDVQPQTSCTSDSAPSAWSGPLSTSSPPSGEEITMVLDVFSASPPNSQPAAEQRESSPSPRSQAKEESPSSRASLAAHRRPGTTVDVRRARRSRSGSRPSLASVNNFLLHPATLLPIGERRSSSVFHASGSVGGLQLESSGDADTLSALHSSLVTTHSHHISQLPSFPESAGPQSALISPGYPSSLASASLPPSPDLLDNIVLTHESGFRHRKRDQPPNKQRPSDGISIDISGEEQDDYTPPSTNSGNRQTFPETPSIFSPMLSPNLSLARGSAFPFSNFSRQRNVSVSRSLRGRSSRMSSRFLVGRSSTTKASIIVRTHKKSLRSKLKRASVASPSGAAVETTIPPTPLIPPPPPPLPSSSHISLGESVANPAPSSPQQLPPPPPPPQLQPPPPPSHIPVVFPSSATHVLPPSGHTRSSPASPSSFDSSSNNLRLVILRLIARIHPVRKSPSGTLR
ncbi:hypothetical protein B0F90DRAFT_619583 [Multifurca ochricompacta]|uniref:Uncharacterized protein n=1 Tax=Multifurca ochricompacta TaxID=376703 RepID=A0AAD4QMT3_9AGAM|nr:hypothetical protein B0F90DRAFT_619583 [Multifurca ochricompacta]